VHSRYADLTGLTLGNCVPSASDPRTVWHPRPTKAIGSRPQRQSLPLCHLGRFLLSTPLHLHHSAKTPLLPRAGTISPAVTGSKHRFYTSRRESGRRERMRTIHAHSRPEVSVGSDVVCDSYKIAQFLALVGTGILTSAPLGFRSLGTDPARMSLKPRTLSVCTDPNFEISEGIRIAHVAKGRSRRRLQGCSVREGKRNA